jgi:hypothetical protein
MNADRRCKYTVRFTQENTHREIDVIVEGLASDQDDSVRRALAVFVQVFRVSDLPSWVIRVRGVEDLGRVGWADNA